MTSRTETKITSFFNRVISRLKGTLTTEGTDRAMIQQTLDDLIRAKPVGSNVPRLHGSPKVHKVDETTVIPPLRPILSMENSPQHGPARYLCKLLEPIRRHVKEYSVQDTFDFVNKVKDLNLSDKQMILLDVKSLFTSVPVKKSIKILCTLVDEIMPNLPIKISELKELLYLCTVNVQFLFQNVFYTQEMGTWNG